MLAVTRSICWPGFGPLMAASVFAVDQAGRLDVGAGLHVLDRVEQRLVVGEVARIAADVQAFAQRRHARVLGARLDDRTVGNGIVGLGGRRGRAQFGELGLQRPETVMRRIEAFERRAGIGGLGDFAQDIGRRRRVIAVIDFRQHPVRRDAAGRQVAGIGEHPNW